MMLSVCVCVCVCVCVYLMPKNKEMTIILIRLWLGIQLWCLDVGGSECNMPMVNHHETPRKTSVWYVYVGIYKAMAVSQ